MSRAGMGSLRFRGLVIVAAALCGCEEAGVNAPLEGSVALQASPVELVIDPQGVPTDEERRLQSLLEPVLGGIERLAFTDLTALVVDGSGDAAADIAVEFRSEREGIFLDSAGNVLSTELTLSSPALRTNSSGIARVRFVLALGTTASGQFKVSAISGALFDTKVLRLTIGAPNRLPKAQIEVSPRPNLVDLGGGSQAVGRPVSFDGRLTTDPDGDPIVCWRWTITYTTSFQGAPSGTEILEGPGVSFFDRIFTSPIFFDVVLEVTDDPDAAGACAYNATHSDKQPIAYVPCVPTSGDPFPDCGVFGYGIVTVLCQDNAAPTAILAGPEVIQVSEPPGTPVTVKLDGTLSTDPETALAVYVWNCNVIPTDPTANEVLSPLPKHDCRYTVGQTKATFTASLMVKDKGTGLVLPSGEFECQETSVPATVTIEVSPFQF